MIYLITGGMGVGKTSLAVEMILNNYEGLFKYETEDGALIDRPLFFCHIDGLDRNKFKAHELTEEQIQSAPLNEIMPNGGVLIVDECDYTYPRRPPSREVPSYVQTLKELRHEGFTLILMTQHPSMLDIYVRQLVNKHIHLERKPIGTKRYEWFGCEENLSPSALSVAASEWYKPSQEAQKYYKSATKHIKFKKKLHKVFYLLPIGALLLIYLLFNIFNRFTGKIDTGKEVAQNIQSQLSASAVSEPVEPMSESQLPVNQGSFSNGDLVGISPKDYEPRIPSLPETKPIYDSLRNPINMETIAGCVKSKNSCNCYTEQATPVYTSKEMCIYWAENGIFQIYKSVNNGAQNSVPIK